MIAMPDAPAPAAAVAVDDVSKTFRIPKEQIHTLKERALHPLRRTTYNEFDALHDVSFEVPRASSSGSSGATAPASRRC